MRHNRFATILGVFATLAFSNGVRADEVTLSVLNYFQNNIDYGATFMQYVNEVNAEGKGKVRLDVRPFGSVPTINIADAVRSGVADMANIPPAWYQSLLPWADGIKLATVSHAEMHRNGAEAFINAAHEKVGLEYLTTYGDGDSFVIYLRDKKITKPEDFKGLKIRIASVYRATLAAFGAELITSPITELTSMLERGVIDGFGYSSLSIRDGGWSKFVKYRVEPAFYTPNNAILMNFTKWQTLPQDVRDLLKRKAIQFASEYSAKYGQSRTDIARKEILEDGITVISFQGDDAKRWLDTAYKAGWEEIDKIDPVNGPKLRELITKH
jgi:TRAP-type C4-dicarboxylate transport system substrate-binding protein